MRVDEFRILSVEKLFKTRYNIKMQCSLFRGISLFFVKTVYKFSATRIYSIHKNYIYTKHIKRTNSNLHLIFQIPKRSLIPSNTFVRPSQPRFLRLLEARHVMCLLSGFALHGITNVPASATRIARQVSGENINTVFPLQLSWKPIGLRSIVFHQFAYNHVESRR